MRKLFLAIAVIISLFKLSAQDSTLAKTFPDTANISGQRKVNPLLYNYTSETNNNIFNSELRQGAHNRLQINFDYSSNSNAAPAAFLFNLLFNRDIPNSLKDRADKRLKNKLLFEDNLKTGFDYQHYFNNWDGTLYFSYNQRQMRSIYAGKQAFEMLFYGNARFEGDTADFSNIRFSNFIYNQFTVGIKKKIDYGSYQMVMGTGLSFLQVINNQEISTNKASIYTAPDGEYLDLNYDLTFNSALQGAPKFFALNGVGVSGDFNIGFMNKDKWKINLDISDLGIMTFRKAPVNYTGTNSIHFQGIVIPDLFALSSQTFDTLKLDSAFRSYLPAQSANAYSLFVPFTANLTFSKPLMHNKLVLTFGLQYRNIPHYNPYGYVKINYFIKPDMLISTSVAAGGYSLCNIGFEFAKSWKYFDFALGSSNILGLVLPSYYTGTGLYLRIASSF